MRCATERKLGDPHKWISGHRIPEHTHTHSGESVPYKNTEKYRKRKYRKIVKIVKIVKIEKNEK